MRKLTPEEDSARRERQRAALRRAIARYPSLAAFSRAIGVSYQLVQHWLKNQVPFRACAPIEKATRGAVKKQELREDWSALMGRG